MSAYPCRYPPNAHQFQQLRSKQYASKRTDDSQDKCDRDRRTDRTMQMLCSFRSEIPGNNNRCSCRQTIHKVDRELKQRIDRIDRAQSHFACKPVLQ